MFKPQRLIFRKGRPVETIVYDLVEGMLKTPTTLVKEEVNAVEDVIEGVAEAAGGVVEGVKDGGKEAIVKIVWQDAGIGGRTLVKGGLQTLKSGAETLGHIGRGEGKATLKSFFGGVLLRGVATPVVAVVRQLLGILNLVPDGWRTGKKTLSPIWEGGKGLLKKTWEGVKTALSAPAKTPAGEFISSMQRTDLSNASVMGGAFGDEQKKQGFWAKRRENKAKAKRLSEAVAAKRASYKGTRQRDGQAAPDPQTQKPQGGQGGPRRTPMTGGPPDGRRANRGGAKGAREQKAPPIPHALQEELDAEQGMTD